jgi:hypothetical protein
MSEWVDGRQQIHRGMCACTSWLQLTLFDSLVHDLFFCIFVCYHPSFDVMA